MTARLRPRWIRRQTKGGRPGGITLPTQEGVFMLRKRDSVLTRTLTPGKARLAGLAAVAAAVGPLIPGAASAATSSSKPAVVHACYAKKGGALRVATHCTSAQRSISWNQTGPKGPAGPK